MSTDDSTAVDRGRRTFFVRTIAAIQGTLAAAFSVVVGGAILSPAFTRRDASWLRAASIDALSDEHPLTVTLRVTRRDGYAQIVDRAVLYLVRVGDDRVQALQSTCTHLGCRTSYDRKSRRILCPCHGGAYDTSGKVLDGPPPAPLPTLETRVEDGEIFVRI